jgi:hypothetical protein
MKKITIASLFAFLAFSASAADFVSVDVDAVKDNVTGARSTAQYVRAGKEIGGLQFGLQSRTAVLHDGGMLNSLEITGGKTIGIVSPFVGIGFDNGFNGARGGDYQYGLVGVTTGAKIGPGFALAGIKTRVGSTAAVETKQTVAFGTYSIPLAKKVSLNINASKSYQDIQENAYGLGLSFSF